MGRQIAIVVWGMDRLGIEAEPGEKPDHYTARVYVEANRRIEADPAITAEVDALMQQVEAQDPATVKKFRTVVARCLDGFKETLADLATPPRPLRLGVGLPPDRGHGAAPRSGSSGGPRRTRTRSSGSTSPSSGSQNRYVLRRSDGTSVYAARDLAYHVWKARNADRVIDVLGADHKLIGASLQAALRLLGEKAPGDRLLRVRLPPRGLDVDPGREVRPVRRPDRGDAAARLRGGHGPPARTPRGGAAVHRLARSRSPRSGTTSSGSRPRRRPSSTGRPRSTSSGSPGRTSSTPTPGPARSSRRPATGARRTPATRSTSRPSPGRSRSSRSSWPRRSRSSGPTSSRRTRASSRTSSTPSTTSSPCSGPRGATRDSRLTLVKAAQNTLKETLETLGIDALASM